MGRDARSPGLIEEDDDDNTFDHDISDHSTPTYEEHYSDDEVEESTSTIIPLSKTNIPSITAAILSAGTTGGTTYAFGLYASALKHSLHLSQSELDTISSAFFCAGLLSWAPGIVVDRFGPKVAMIVGGVLGAISLMLYWVVSIGAVPIPRELIVVTLSLLGVSTYVSSALVTGSVFKVIVQYSGKGQKGTAVGAAKGYVGLGSGAYACIFEAIRGPHGNTGGGDDGVQDGGDPSDLNFLPMAAFFAVAAVTIPALCLLESKSATESQPRKKVEATTALHFRIVYLGLLGLGAVVVGTSVLELFASEGGDGSANHDVHSSSSGSREWFKAIFIVFMWFGPISAMLCLPRKNNSDAVGRSREDEEETAPVLGRKKRNKRKQGGKYDLVPPSSLNPDDDDNDEEENLNGHSDDNNVEMEKLYVDGAVATTEEDTSEDQEEFLLSPEDVESNTDSHSHHNRHHDNGVESLTLTQMLQTAPAWLLLWTCTILAGGGTVMTNNVGQMVESLELHPTTAPASLALFSAAQAAARVLTGSISEWALSSPKYALPRPAFLVIASFGGCAAHFLLGMATSEIAFVIGVALSGAAFGMIWPLMVLIVGECFGADHVGANYMFYDGVTSAIGTLILSKFVTQEVYESHIDESHGDVNPYNDGATAGGGTAGDGLTCYGEGCFQLSHFIVAGLSISCVISSVALMFNTRHVYENRSI